MTSNTPYSSITLNSLKTLYEYPETIILIARVYGSDAAAGLGVIPRFQRKGLGTVIGMAAWNYFKKKGVKELRCEVYKDNIVSYNFIKSIGFEEFGRKVYKSEDFDIDS